MDIPILNKGKPFANMDNNDGNEATQPSGEIEATSSANHNIFFYESQYDELVNFL